MIFCLNQLFQFINQSLVLIVSDEFYCTPQDYRKLEKPNYQSCCFVVKREMLNSKVNHKRVISNNF